VIKRKNIFYIIIFILFLTTSSFGEIKDNLFATVGDKALTDSDVINEIKTILILNNQSYTKERKKELQSIAIRRIIERAIKRIETEKYDFLEFNQIDLDNQINSFAQRVNVSVDTLKTLFEKNGLDFEQIKKNVITELLWNNLMISIYKNNLTVNEDEINQQLANFDKNTESNEYLISEIVLKSVESNKLDEELNKVKNMIKDIGFEKTAMTISVSANSTSGGDIGWIEENSIAKKFKSRIINTPVGEVSKPIVLPEGIIIFTVRDKRKSNKVVDLESIRKSLIEAERNKILNMYSLSHYESLTRKIAVNYN
jgi:parvulin-like peptidyl-prolyl isomerase